MGTLSNLIRSNHLYSAEYTLFKGAQVGTACASVREGSLHQRLDVLAN